MTDHVCSNAECIERLTRMETTLDALVRAVQGNGQPGIIQRVAALETWRSGIVAVIAFLTTVGGLIAAVFGGHK